MLADLEEMRSRRAANISGVNVRAPDALLTIAEMKGEITGINAAIQMLLDMKEDEYGSD